MTGSASIGKTSFKEVNTKEKSSVDFRAYISQRQYYLLGKRIIDISVSVLVLLFQWKGPWSQWQNQTAESLQQVSES